MSTTSSVQISTSGNFTNECIVDHRITPAMLVTIPAIQVMINVFIIIIIILNRNRLRQNSIYCYVINALAANLVFGIMSGLHMLIFTTDSEKIEGRSRPNRLYPEHQSLKMWWTFRTGWATGLFITTTGSVFLLIHGIRINSYFVGKTTIYSSGLSQKSSASHKPRMSLRSKLIKTIAILNWIIPIILSIIAATTNWNCSLHCFCTHGNYLYVQNCHTDEFYRCSTLHEPLQKSFIVIIFSLWLVQILGIIAMLHKTYEKYKKSKRYLASEESNRSSLNTKDQLPQKASNIQISTIGKERQLTNAQSSNTIKLLMSISISFIALTFPELFLNLLDFFNLRVSGIFNVIAIEVLLLYCCIKPILLVCLMPTLRRAVIRSLFDWRCCYSETVVKRPVSS